MTEIKADNLKHSEIRKEGAGPIIRKRKKSLYRKRAARIKRHIDELDKRICKLTDYLNNRFLGLRQVLEGDDVGDEIDYQIRRLIHFQNIYMLKLKKDYKKNFRRRARFIVDANCPPGAIYVLGERK